MTLRHAPQASSSQKTPQLALVRAASASAAFVAAASVAVIRSWVEAAAEVEAACAALAAPKAKAPGAGGAAHASRVGGVAEREADADSFASSQGPSATSEDATRMSVHQLCETALPTCGLRCTIQCAGFHIFGAGHGAHAEHSHTMPKDDSNSLPLAPA